MWSALVDFGIWVLGLFGFGKPDLMAQGEKLGKAESQAADDEGELNAISKANAARNSVSDNPSDFVSDPANSGPAKPL